MAEHIRVLLTSCGGLAVPGMVECLRAEKAYDFHVVGVDASPAAVGAHFVDRFYTVPGGLDPNYVESLLNIATREQARVIVPLSDEEALPLAQQRQRFAAHGIAVLCSSAEATATACDKGRLLSFLRERNVPVPPFRLPRDLGALDAAVSELGYPQREVVLKPTRGRGGRGFWILTQQRNGQDLLLTERPMQRLPYTVARTLLAERPTLPPLVVMQYLRGADFNVDVLARRGAMLYCIPIERIVPEAGPVRVGRTVHDDAIAAVAAEAVAALGCDYNINVELAYAVPGDHGPPLIYEINPRVSAPIATHRAAGVNLLLFGILAALGRPVPAGLRYECVTLQRCWHDVYC